MSLSFKTVQTLDSGKLRAATDETSGKTYYKFIGEKRLSLEEVTELMRGVGAGAQVTEVESKRSGYKYKTTWSV